MQGILEYYYLVWKIYYMEIKVIMLVIESFEKFTILIKLQMVKIISPFWSICSIFNLKFLQINNINIIIALYSMIEHHLYSEKWD